MERTNREIFHKIVFKQKTNNLRLFVAGILMPIFLFATNAAAIEINPAQLYSVVFEIKDDIEKNFIAEKYGFTLKHLFGDVYKTKTSDDIFLRMKSDPSFDYVEKDGMVSTSLVTTNDPFFTTDKLLDDKQWYLPMTQIPDAWDYSKGSNAVIVAIIDTGIHANHLELSDGRVIGGYNILTGQVIQPNTNSDDNGHGTAVAGVIGAIPNNLRGMTGVNWNISLMPIKTLMSNGTGDISDLAAGIVWAADHGADIINMSLGGPGFGADMTLGNAIKYAYEKGVLIVSAAGNDLAEVGQNLDQNPIYPICADNDKNMVLGVAATDVHDLKAGFSNYGSRCVDISAPGKKILTTAFLPSDPSDNLLIYGSGTSLATPIVSGVAALLKANNANLTNVDLQNIIKNRADNIYPVNQTTCANGSCDNLLGTGRINALNAIKPAPVAEGTLLQEPVTGNIYIVSNNLKRLVSNYVFTQRGYQPSTVIVDAVNLLRNIPLGTPLPPSDGTLIKAANDPTVYVIHEGLRRPVTYLVFVSRQYSFANVTTLLDAEVLSYQAGDWYWPPDGTLVLIRGNPLVYVMDQQVARPTTFFVFTQRGLSFTKVIEVTEDEFTHVPRPSDPYWLPPMDGTLIKSQTDPGIYVIELGMKRLLSYQQFIARGYNFRNVKALPQAEMDVIALGTVIE